MADEHRPPKVRGPGGQTPAGRPKSAKRFVPRAGAGVSGRRRTLVNTGQTAQSEVEKYAARSVLIPIGQGRPAKETIAARETPFGDALRMTRHQASVTLEQLGDAVGLSAAHISKIERGRHVPRRDRVEQLAERLTDDIELREALYDKRDIAELVANFGFDPAVAHIALLLHRGDIDVDVLSQAVAALPAEAQDTLARAVSSNPPKRDA